MEQRLPGKKLAQALKEMKQISRIEFVCVNKKWKMLTSTVPNLEEKVQELVVLFAKSMADSQTIQNWIFLKIEINDQTENILLASNNGAGDASYVIGQMACCQIRNLYLAAQEPTNEINFLRQLLNGEFSEQQIQEKRHQIRMKNGTYMIFVIQFADEQNEIILEMLKNMFVVYGVDYLIDVDDKKMVLIKNVRGIDVENDQFARRIIDNLQMEAMCNAWVGYTDAAEDFVLFHEKYRQASMALKVGMVFSDDERVFYYRRLGSFYVLLNLMGNVLCFMPLGFVLPVLSYKNRSIFKVTFMCMLCSVTVELIQLISKLGSCDVDDVILNTSGGILGYICFAICMFIFRHKTEKKNKKKNRRK